MGLIRPYLLQTSPDLVCPLCVGGFCEYSVQFDLLPFKGLKGCHRTGRLRRLLWLGDGLLCLLLSGLGGFGLGLGLLSPRSVELLGLLCGLPLSLLAGLLLGAVLLAPGVTF